MPHADPKVRAEYLRKYREKNWDVLAAKKKAYYRSTIIERKRYDKEYNVRNSERRSLRMKTYLAQNAETIHAKRRVRWRAVKKRLMDYYGGRCVGCGTTELAILTIDHVNDDGKEERARIKAIEGVWGVSGAPWYQKLLLLPRRPDLQVLCWNCQRRKIAYGPDISKWRKQSEEYFSEQNGVRPQ